MSDEIEISIRLNGWFTIPIEDLEDMSIREWLESNICLSDFDEWEVKKV